MSFASMNSFNAAKGMSGTTRTNTATFNPAAAQPLTAAPQGMTVNYGAPATPAPNQAKGSSYTLNGGMMGTGRAMADMADSNGVVTGRQGPMANIGQQAPQLTQEEMQDPANAAMAGFQFASTQDQAPSAPIAQAQRTRPAAPAPPPPVPGMKQFATLNTPPPVPGMKQSVTLNTPMRAAGLGI